MKANYAILLTLFITIQSCQTAAPVGKPAAVPGRLRVGFDIDDTVLFSRELFLKAPSLSGDPDHLDYGWINQHDSLYSVTIKDTRDLIDFLRAQGHAVYFITARPGTHGAHVGRHLSRELGFDVQLGKNLFFAPKKKDTQTGLRHTTKHEVMQQLQLHLFYGDSDTDMIAATLAGIRAVRVVRHPASTRAYSKNYFGDTLKQTAEGAVYDSTAYDTFIQASVGPYGETIFPIYHFVDN